MTETEAGQAPPAYVLVAAGVSDVGKVRQGNEDSWAHGRTLAVVADGLGGHAGGEVASALAVKVVGATFAADPTLAGLLHGVEAAHQAIQERAELEPSLTDMGTTLCLLAVTDDVGLVLVNVGDSRAYGIDGQDAVRLTWDDSWVFAQVDAGLLTLTEAATHPRRNILTHAVGPAGMLRISTVRPTQWPRRVVLASDGLSDLVPDAVIGALGGVGDPATAAAALVEAALAAGGTDNVTVVVVDITAIAAG